MIVYIWIGLMTIATLAIFGCLFYLALVLIDKILDLRETINILIDDIIDWWNNRI